MKHTFRRLFLFLPLCLLLALLAACGSADESSSEEAKPERADFLYEIHGGEATIVGYAGLDTEVVIPENIDGYPVTAIAENAFRAVKALSEVTIPDSVTTIDYAFPECKELTRVVLGRGITSMNGAFRGCTALADVEGGELAVFLDEAFEGCTSLLTASIPASAKSCQSTFRGCTSLQSVTIAEGITALNMTFRDCESLRQVHLPTSVTTTYATFENCLSLYEVTGGEGISVYDKTFKNCVCLTELTLSTSVTRLCDAFTDCQALRTVTNLPNEVTVYTASFNGCKALTAIVVPAITDPEALAAYNASSDFEGCSAAKTITIYAATSVMEDFCKLFSGCMSLEEVTLPENMVTALLRVDVTHSDALFTGTNKTVTNAVNKYKKASSVRVTDHYGIIETVAYTHIYGGDVNAIDTDKVIAATAVLGFTPFEKVSYWCGYPTGGNRRNETVAIARTYSFYLRVSGKNNGTLPPEVYVNGMHCTVEG